MPKGEMLRHKYSFMFIINQHKKKYIYKYNNKYLVVEFIIIRTKLIYRFPSFRLKNSLQYFEIYATI